MVNGTHNQHVCFQFDGFTKWRESEQLCIIGKWIHIRHNLSVMIVYGVSVGTICDQAYPCRRIPMAYCRGQNFSTVLVIHCVTVDCNNHITLFIHWLQLSPPGVFCTWHENPDPANSWFSICLLHWCIQFRNCLGRHKLIDVRAGH